MPPARPSSPAARPRWALAATIAAVLGGLLLGAALALELFVVERLPELTAETLDAAEKLWQANGPTGYDMDLEIRGAQPGIVHVEVRGGVTTAMQRDGLAPRERRVWEYWSVPGRLDELERELELAADPVHEMDVSAGTRVDVRCEFDSDFGFPRRFHRITYGGGTEVYWRVTNFQPK